MMTPPIGEMVELNGGSAPMTVVATDGNTVTCAWTDAKKMPRRECYPAAALKIYKAPLTLEQLVKASYEKRIQ